MAVSLNIPSFPKFDLDEYNTISTRWEKYKKRFLNLCVALNVEEEKQKLALFLNYIGEEAYDIYDNLLVTRTDQTYDTAVALLDAHFNPKKNVDYEVYLFRKLKQEQDENMHQFYVRVKQQGNKCDFGANTEKEIKQQLVLSTNNNKLRRYAFKNTEVSLTDFLTYAKQLEDSELKADEVAKTNKQEEEVNKLTRQLSKFGKNRNLGTGTSHFKSGNTCFRCGGIYPHPNSCPAEGKECKKCLKTGHFARCCKSSEGRKLRGNRSVNKLATSNSSESSDNNDDENSYLFTLFDSENPDEFMSYSTENDMIHKSLKVSAESLVTAPAKYSTHAEVAPVNSISKFHAEIKVEGHTAVRFLIDTGSSLNILNKKTFDKINKNCKGTLKIRKTSTKVITYGQEKPAALQIIGVVSLLVENDKTITLKEFYIIDTKHKNLLNGTAAIELRLISLSTPDIQKHATRNNTQNQINKTDKTSVKENKVPNKNQNSAEEINTTPTRIQPLINSYKQTIFKAGNIGKFTDYQVKLHIDEKVAPVAQPERRVPFALRQKVKQTVDKLESLGIIEEVKGKPTPWLNPIVVVQKGKNDIRICLDMRSANKAITRTRYPTPVIDDLLIKLKDCKHFAKLDLNSAFHQLELEPSCRYITAFRTEKRIMQYKRLIFGANSAAEELQYALQSILIDIEGAANIADDILIYAKTTKEHDEILSKVFKRLAEKGLTLNLQKCVFDKRNLEYFGYIFSADGIKPSPTKTQALKNANRPEDLKALRSFLGMTNYLKRFIPNYSTITYPLRRLTQKDVKYEWNQECENAFQSLKTSLSEDSCISYFDESKETLIYCDASPVGISAILLQRTKNKNDTKVIAYSSRSLTSTEMRYSQIERETLAVTYACGKNHLYLLGRSFILYNDNKALTNILNNPKSVPPPRIERMLLRIQGYTFTTEYVKSGDNVADYLSRHPTSITSNLKYIENHVNFISTYASLRAITLDDIKLATKTDPFLQKLIDITVNNTWHMLDKLPDSEETKMLKHYRKMKDTLTVNEEQNIILKDKRIILPRIYHRISVKLGHIGHQGLAKTKALLRSKISFIGMDKLIEEEILNCIPCQATVKKNSKTPLQPTEIPDRVWHTVNTDYLGPLPDNKYALVMIDQRSRYPIVTFTNNTTAKNFITICNHTFAHFGFPEKLISDNGPPFRSKDVKNYATEKGIKHQRITPLWPQANGEVERFMLPLTKVICTAHIENKNYVEEVQKFLMAYRVTPHTSTNIAPSDLMYRRKVRYTIPDYTQHLDDFIDLKLKHNDERSKSKAQIRYDQHAKDPMLEIGNRVLVKQRKVNKLTPPFNPSPYRITEIKGTMISAQNPNTDHRITRNATHFKKLPETALEQPLKIDTEEEDDEGTQGVICPNPEVENPQSIVIPTTQSHQPEANVTQPPPRKTYPRRNRRPLDQWKKY